MCPLFTKSNLANLDNVTAQVGGSIENNVSCEAHNEAWTVEAFNDESTSRRILSNIASVTTTDIQLCSQSDVTCHRCYCV
jgi:hypothetical protein